MPALFSSHNVQHILVCKSMKELHCRNKFVWSCKARNEEHRKLSPFQDLFRNSSILYFPFKQMQQDFPLRQPKAVVSEFGECRWAPVSKSQSWSYIVLRWRGRVIAKDSGVWNEDRLFPDCVNLPGRFPVTHFYFLFL